MPLPKYSKKQLLAAAAALFVARIFYKLGRWIYHVLTSVDQSKKVHHNCVPPPDFKHTAAMQSTMELVKQQHPELLELVESGNLIVLQPAKMLAALLEQQKQQQQRLAGEQQQPHGLSEADLNEMMASHALQACMAAEVPELMYVVGTVHVSKQSAVDVKRVLRAVRPELVVLELCQPRMQALLVDPYADPRHDLEPCPNKAAAAAALKHKSVPEILQAAFTSRDHNVLTQMMGGMYSQLEDKLEVRAGVEFIAARQVLIEMQQEQEQQQQQQQLQQASQGSSSEEPATAASPEDGSSWYERCVPGDRPVMDTLLGLWGALGPWRRLRFIGDLLWGLLAGVDEETIAELAKEDMVEVLLKEFSEAYPEVMKPLLHDRNWVLATNTWHAAQAARGPVVAIVGKGHMCGIVYVVQWLVGMMAKTGGMPVMMVHHRMELQAEEERGSDGPSSLL